MKARTTLIYWLLVLLLALFAGYIVLNATAQYGVGPCAAALLLPLAIVVSLGAARRRRD